MQRSQQQFSLCALPNLNLVAYFERNHQDLDQHHRVHQAFQGLLRSGIQFVEEMILSQLVMPIVLISTTSGLHSLEGQGPATKWYRGSLRMGFDYLDRDIARSLQTMLVSMHSCSIEAH